MFNIVSRFRFLPVTIFAAVLMLTVKVGNIWEDIEGIVDGAISIADAQAQQKTAPQPAEAVPEPAKSDATAENGGPEGGESAAAASLLSDDPTLLTQAEIDLLQQLAERREVIEAREKELDMRDGMMKAAESRINKKIEELKAFQATISKLIKTYDEQQASKMLSLVKIYENMKPGDAARIFEEMDMDTLLSVVERMKERKLAPVMAKMDPVKATEITVELSRLRQLPEPGQDAGG